MQPAIGLKFIFQLPWRPSGIAKGEEGLVGPVAGGNSPQDVECRRQVHTIIDGQGAVLEIVVGGMQDEAAACLDRTADMNL